MKHPFTHLALIVVVSFAGFFAVAGDCMICPPDEGVVASSSTLPPCHALVQQATTRIGAPCCCRISSLPESDAAGAIMPAPVFSASSFPRFVVAVALPTAVHDSLPRDSYFRTRDSRGPPASHNDALALRMTFVI